MNNIFLEIKESQDNILTEIKLMIKELEKWREIITYANFHPRPFNDLFTKELNFSEYQTTSDFLQAKKLSDIDYEMFDKLVLVLARQINTQLIYSENLNQKIYFYPEIMLEKALLFYQNRN